MITLTTRLLFIAAGLLLGAAALAGSVLITLAYSIGSYFVEATKGHDSGTGEPIRRYYHRFTIPLTAILGRLLQVQIACLALGSLPFTYGWAERHGDGNLFGAISVAIAYIGTWREKHAAMYGFQTIADIRQGAPHDHAHGVIEIALAHLVFDVDANHFFGELCHQSASLITKKGRWHRASSAYASDPKSTP